MIISNPFRILIITLFSICFILLTSIVGVKSQEKGLVSAYIGIWSGSGNQQNGSEWSILLSIVPGSIDSVVGTIAYPSLSCGGELTLQRIKNGSIELFENLTYGIGTCVNRGTDIFKLSSSRKLEFSWISPKGQREATGILRKISSN
jgi:hypothetical protein